MMVWSGGEHGGALAAMSGAVQQVARLLRLDPGDREAGAPAAAERTQVEPVIVWNIPPAESWIRD